MRPHLMAGDSPEQCMQAPTTPADDAQVLIHKLTVQNNDLYADLCRLGKAADLAFNAWFYEENMGPKAGIINTDKAMTAMNELLGELKLHQSCPPVASNTPAPK